MKFPGSHYYKATDILLSSIGLWPYRDSLLRHVQIAIFLTLLLSGVAVQLMIFCTTEYSMDLLLMVFAYTGPWVNYTIKYIVVALHTNGIKNIMNEIQHDWNTLRNKEEIKIMEKHTSRGSIFAVISSRVTYTSLGCFVLMELIPNFLDFVAPLNEPRPHALPVLVEYFVDQEEYFSVILLHIFAVGAVGFTVVMASETTLLLFILHMCGKLEIACYRIQCALNEKHVLACISRDDAGIILESIVAGIRIHKQANEFFLLLKSTFQSSYYFLLPIGVATLSVNLYRFSKINCMENLEECSTTVLFIMGHFGYLFICNFMMEIGRNYEAMFYAKVYDTDWYAAPTRIKKIVLFLLQRNSKTFGINIAGLYAPSLEGFVTNSEISLFETNIRFMGSLLACYALTGDVMFRDKAAQLGERMLPAFQTETGIPHSLINLHSGASKNYGWASSGCSILSEIGTMHLEFTYLSDITGNPVFKSKVENVRKVLKNLEKPKGLYPNYIHPRTGKWGQHHMSLGGLGDSFYEYLLKAWIQSGKEDIEAREMYDEAIAAIDQHMIKTSPGKLLYVSDLKYDRPEHKMGHLACFAGGMFALGAKTMQNEVSGRYMTIAAGLTNTCHESYDRSYTKLGPEAFHFIEGNEAKSLKNGEKYYILRPETFESYFVMWRLTKDPKYREWGWEAVEALEKYCRVPGGFSGLHNVYLPDPPKDDVQQSYFFAETLKYLYLLFSDDDLINLDEWVFNSEAHVLPIRGNPLYRQAPSL